MDHAENRPSNPPGDEGAFGGAYLEVPFMAPRASSSSPKAISSPEPTQARSSSQLGTGNPQQGPEPVLQSETG